MSEYYLLNTNKGNLPEGNDGTAVYDLGVAATYGSKSEILGNDSRTQFVVNETWSRIYIWFLQGETVRS